MAGIIQNAQGTPGLTQTQTPDPAGNVAQAATTTFTPTKLPDPTKWEVTPEQTVAGQITKLTDPSSPLIAQARSRADQAMNSRGLANSSIAATAADSAAYDAALPIAQADAAAFGKAAGYNVDTKNQFATTDQANQTQVGLANTQATNANAQFNTGQKNQVQSNKDLATIEAQYKNLTQASASATSLLNGVASSVARIMENTTLDAAAKQKAIDVLNANAQKSLQMIGAISGDVDLVSFFDEIFAG